VIFVRYHCKPTQTHAEYDTTGDTWVNGWIRVRSFAEAKARARRELRNGYLKVVRLEEIGRVSRESYPEDASGRAYYDEAQEAGEVFVFYSSVKHPVFCVDFEAVTLRSNRNFPRKAHATVKYWVLNEKVARQFSADNDMAADESYADFWKDRKHREMAVTLGRKKIQDYGWRVTAVCNAQPVCYDDYAGNALLLEHYDEAEERGECTAFWTDVPPD
jgi:hypothetical protein